MKKGNLERWNITRNDPEKEELGKEKLEKKNPEKIYSKR